MYEEQGTRWRLILAVMAVAVFVAAVSGGLAGAGIALMVSGDDDSEPAAVAAAGNEPPSTVLQVSEASAATDTFAKVSPGVVTLIVQAQNTDANGRATRETNLGSGVIIDDRGYIVTNEHVVRGATRIVVKLANGEERPGVLVGDDKPFTDIAVVRMQPDNLTVVPVGDSDALVPGQGVLTIGSIAFSATLIDFRNTITRGVVSGIHRRWPRDDTVMEDVIQTDAAINHGNSGGPLLTLNGQVVGIVTTVIRSTQAGQAVQGVGFAIPSKVFMPIVTELIATGKTTRPYVGIVHKQVTAEVAAQNRLPPREGAVVLDVLADSPAARAGVQRGDLITKVADADVTEDQPYLNILARQRIDSTVPLTLLRSGREMTLDITIVARQ